MAETLSRSAQKVQDILRSMGYSHTVQELPASTRSAAEAAAALGCQVAQIAKSLVFRGAESGAPILIVASGVNRVNEARAAEILGESLAKADADFCREATGFAIGGIPPVGHAQPLRILIDADLLQYEHIWAAAGTPRAVFELTPADLVAMTGGQVVAIA
jgi:prolyl-tRNA editing enzyme YbaK/EbsC (Cys-tRNA(Pro) deacylase)